MFWRIRIAQTDLTRKIEDLATPQERLDFYTKNVYNLSVYKNKIAERFYRTRHCRSRTKTIEKIGIYRLNAFALQGIEVQTNPGEFDT